MNIDPGLAVVIIAVLVFYLRLIILQRQRAKRLVQPPAVHGSRKKKEKRGSQPAQLRYSIISPRTQDRIIALTGVLAVLVGILLNTRIIPLPAGQPYWWIPTALGIIAFSWAFKL